MNAGTTLSAVGHRCSICGRRWSGRHSECGSEGAAPIAVVPDDLPTTIEVAGYRVDRMIGYGGFASVWSAVRERDVRPVAIKVARSLSPLHIRRLMIEGDVQRAIGPPHAPAVHDAGTLDNGAGFLVMDLLASASLAALLEQYATGLVAEQFAATALGLVDAVAAVHAHGYIHGDLKPENVFVGLHSTATLIDFGQARKRGVAVDSAQAIAGSPEYMSPEQVEGATAIEVASDLYSVGIMLYEMLTARTPFVGTVAELHHAHRTRRPPLLSSQIAVNPALEAVVMRCLAKDPANRFADAVRLGAALREALADGAVNRVPATAVSKRPARQRHAMAVLYFRSSAELPDVQAALQPFDGRIGQVGAAGFVAIFEPHDGAPLHRALRAAEALVVRRLCPTVIVDVAPIVVQVGSSGRRYAGAALTQRASYPLDTDPPGVLLGERAAELAADVATTPVAGRPAFVRVETSADAGFATHIARVAAEPVFGRDRALAQLIASAQAARDAKPTIATIIGDRGHGKTHVAAAVLTALRALDPPVDVWELRAREPVAGHSCETLRAILHRTLELPTTAPADRGRALVNQRLGDGFGAEAWAAVAVTMGWVGPDDPAVAAIAAAPGALRATVSRVAGFGLRRLASARPCCLLIDDAHQLDAATLDALEAATLTEHHAPLWIGVAALPGFEHSRPQWGRRATASELVRLAALEPESAAALCRHLLQPVENPPRSAIDKLVERTQGVPVLLVELVRGLRRDGLIRQHKHSEAWFLATDELERLPELPVLEWVAQRELAGLPAELRAHATLVALLGTELTLGEIGGVIRELDRAGIGSEFPLDAGIAVRRLQERELLTARRHGRVSFRNQLVRDVVIEAAPGELRRSVHQAAFRFYNDPSSVSDAERLPRLAFHAECSGERLLAATLYLQLGERARARHTYLEAEQLYTRGVALVDDGDLERRLTAGKGRGVMRYRLGRYDDAIADLDAAAELAQRLGRSDAEVEVLLEAATIRDWMGDPARSKELVERAKGLAGPSPSREVVAGLLMGEARSLFRFGEWAKASEVYQRAVASAEPLGDAGYETLIASLALLGPILASLGRIAEAEQVFDRAIALCNHHGDRLHLGVIIHNRLLLWQVLRDGERARQDIHQFLDIGREMGLMDVEFRAEYNLADIAFQSGALAIASVHVERAIELAERIGGATNPQRPAAVLLKARLALLRGDLGGAGAVVAHLRATAGELLPNDAMFARMVELAIGDGSDGEWDAVETLATEVGTQQDPIEVAEARGLSAWRHGRTDIARRSLQRAVELSSTLPNLMTARVQVALDDLERTIAGAA